MNQELRSIEIGGKILDLGAGTIRSSYFSFLRQEEPLEVVSMDIMPDRKPDIIADLEEMLPIESGEYDSVLCFNLLEHVFHHAQLLSEIGRVLKPGGRLIGYVPFLVKFHPDPKDYFRYTEQGLVRLFREAGFEDVDIRFVGKGMLTASWSQIEYILPRAIRWPITLLAFGLDVIILKLKPVFQKKYALGYLFIAHIR